MKRKKRSSKFRIILVLITLAIFGTLIFIKTKSDLYNEVVVVPNTTKVEMAEESKITEKSSFPTEVYGIPVYTDLIEANTPARPGTKRKIKYIVIHETDNFERGVGAKNHAIYLKQNNTLETSWHYTVDDKEIYHHVPDNEIAYHAGEHMGNEYGIGVELCVNQDGNYKKTFENATKLVAYLLKEYNLTTEDIKTHHDFSGKDCPHSILKQNRMTEFKNKVRALLN